MTTRTLQGWLEWSAYAAQPWGTLVSPAGNFANRWGFSAHCTSGFSSCFYAFAGTWYSRLRQSTDLAFTCRIPLILEWYALPPIRSFELNQNRTENVLSISDGQIFTYNKTFTIYLMKKMCFWLPFDCHFKNLNNLSPQVSLEGLR